MYIHTYILVYVPSDMFVCVSDVSMSLLCPVIVPAALRCPEEKYIPGEVEHMPCVLGQSLPLVFAFTGISLILHGFM